MSILELLNKVFSVLEKHVDIIIAFLVLSIIFVMIVPIPEIALDMLITINIALSVLIFLLTIFTTDILQLSIFPSLLLITTLFRLSLNVSSTRLILGGGSAGRIVKAFGVVVTGNNYIVGAIIFIIIIVVQFVVITNGSGRVAEVAARFTLDALPGKQMSIEADLSSGLINEKQAKKRRDVLQQEAEFYGAMDGANKFVKGDAIVGIVIVIINFLGGVLISSVNGGGINEALSSYAILTIGDGLVSQIPALLISVSAGILVTRTTTDQNLGQDVAEQLLGLPEVILMVAGVVLLLGFVPGIPFLPFTIMAALIGGAGYLLLQDKISKEEVAKQQVIKKTKSEPIPQKTTEEQMLESARIEPLELEIGLSLLSLVNKSDGKDLVARLLNVRKQIAGELGVISKSIRLKDNMNIDENEYRINIKGNTVGSGTVYPNQLLVMNPTGGSIDVPGIDVVEPVFNLNAKWITKNNRNQAEKLGYTVIDDITVLITHVKEVIKQNAHELISNQEVKMIIDSLKDENNVIIDELIPDIFTISQVTKILKNLIKEYVPINDIITILETLLDNGRTTKDIEQLTEYVRASLGRTIVNAFIDENNTLTVMTLNPELEKMVAENMKKSFQGTYSVVDPNTNTIMLKSIDELVQKSNLKQKNAVVVTSPKIRAAFKKLIQIPYPKLQVLSLNEIPNDVYINVVGMVKNK